MALVFALRDNFDECSGSTPLYRQSREASRRALSKNATTRWRFLPTVPLVLAAEGAACELVLPLPETTAADTDASSSEHWCTAQPQPAGATIFRCIDFDEPDASPSFLHPFEKYGLGLVTLD